jgi:peptidoglycan/xylan/chitin deacetylase (PgdA/CDA1 family)
MDTIQWDVDSLDWRGIAASEIAKRVTEKAAPGSIVLFHNAAEHTPEALPSIIEFFLQNGYSLVPVSELLLTGEYTIDHTGKQMAAGR